jgi:hypothetical protein
LSEKFEHRQQRIAEGITDFLGNLLRTEGSYVQWIRRFILFHGKRHPSEMGAPEVEAVLLHPSITGYLAAS